MTTLQRSRSDGTGTPTVGRQLMVKVPAIVTVFWFTKIVTTGMGEAMSDFMVERWGMGLAAALAGMVLVFALGLQFKADRYRPATYWFAVSMVAVFGTVGSDVFVPPAGGPLNVPLPYIALGYAIALTICFTLWYRTEHTLAIHSIRTPRREAFYWATVLLTFALGTSAGDNTAFYLNLGFVTSIYMFVGAILVPWALWKARLLNEVAAFWVAYVLTRPIGASLADEFSQEKPMGLGYGAGLTALVAIGAIVVLVVYLVRSRADTPVDEASSPGAPAVSGRESLADA